MRYDIIIPHYGSGQLTAVCRRCLERLRACSSNYRLIFIDNGSPEFHQLEREIRCHPHLLIRNTRNLGFVQAVNEGLAISTAPRIVILNNDTEVVPGWLESLDAALVGNVGLAGPRTNTAKSWQGAWRGRTGIYLLSRTAMLAFFCVMIRRDVFQRVGYLDTRFGLGFGDDDDYCYRAHRAGFRLAFVASLMIPHHHRSTFRTLYSGAQVKSLQEAAHRKFRAKWNGLR
jgi:GT2 family glycosyltransferase